MERCKNCLWWDTETCGDEISFRKCLSSKIHRDFTFPYPSDFAVWSDDEVVVEYDEEWGILTGPEFGCVHWKEKE